MLRVTKILAYVAERIEAAPEKKAEGTEKDTENLGPEQYLDLYCYDQVCFTRSFPAYGCQC